MAFCMMGLLALDSFAQEDYPMEQNPQRQEKTDFTEEQIMAFVNVNDKVVKIQEESEQGISKMLEKEGLTLEQFNEILAAQKNKGQELNTSADEMASFNKVKQKIRKKKQATDKQIKSSIQEAGLDMDTYKHIMVAYQQDANTKQQVDAVMENDN